MLVLKSGLLIFNLVFFYDWRAAACGTLDGARSRYIQKFFFLIFHSKFFFSYIFREKINVVSGRAWGERDRKEKKQQDFFFHVMLFLSLALSSKIGIVVLVLFFCLFFLKSKFDNW